MKIWETLGKRCKQLKGQHKARAVLKKYTGQGKWDRITLDDDDVHGCKGNGGSRFAVDGG